MNVWTYWKCPSCGAALVLRTTKKGNNAGKQFYGCSKFPKCRYVRDVEEQDILPGTEPIAKNTEEIPALPVPEPAPAPIQESEPAKTCPRCGAALVLRTAKKGENAGKQFYGCSAFPKCRYIQNVEESECNSK